MTTTLYIRSTGSDANDGSSGSPFLTAQRAFDVAYAGWSADNSQSYVLDFGAGSFGGVIVGYGSAWWVTSEGSPLINSAAEWPSAISVTGAGATQSFLGGIDGTTSTSMLDYGQGPRPADISITSDQSINLGFVNGNYLGNGSAPGTTISLTGCVAGNVANGGMYGGLISLTNTIAGELSSSFWGAYIILTNSQVGLVDFNYGNYFWGGDAPTNFAPDGSSAWSFYDVCTGTILDGSLAVFDPRGFPCTTAGLDEHGFCCGSSTGAFFDCAGSYYSPSNEDGNTLTDPNGATCHYSSVDALGYCCGDAATTDCYGNYYSPSNEDGNTLTDPNGATCHTSSVDGLGYCCGNNDETIIGDAVVSGGDFTGSISGNATFINGAVNSGTVLGDAAFNNGANFGTVSGDAAFNDYSYNDGSVAGNATFYDYSRNSGTVLGDATFYDYSENNTPVGTAGNAIFRDHSYNTSWSLIWGYSDFYDFSYASDASNLESGASFHDYSIYYGVYQGPGVGHITFFGAFDLSRVSLFGSYYPNGVTWAFDTPVWPTAAQVLAGVAYGPESELTGTLVATAARPSVNIGALIGLPPFIQL